jgi:sulfopyruvate decarboxylase TPP-binding subunit
VVDEQEGGLSPVRIVNELKANEITHVVWLPDSETNFLYQLLESDATLNLIVVSREGQAFSTAAGLVIGGKKPVVLIQNTGLLESGDSLRGWGIGLNMPIVVMVGYRGWNRRGVTSEAEVALFTEPMLNALGIRYYLVENDSDADRIGVAFADAERLGRPVAILVGDEFHGFNR